jgi:hypothetical protein
LCNFMVPGEVVEAWHGPLGAPHDFVFQKLRVEAKAIGPSAKRIQITSAEQLEAPPNVALRLVAVVLAQSVPEDPDSFTLNELVSELKEFLAPSPMAAKQFALLLEAAGLSDVEKYEHITFRLDGIRSFAVSEGFPRLVRSQLMMGIDEVTYSIDIPALGEFERAFGE